MIAEGHLSCCGSGAVSICRIGSGNMTVADQLGHLAVKLKYILVNRYVELILVDPDLYQYISFSLQFRCDHIGKLCHVYRKGNQGRRYIYVIEGTGHGILAADAGQAVSNLGIISTQQSGEGLAPTLRILGHSAEVFLECEMQLFIVTACCHDLGNRLCHCINRAVIRAPGREIRIKSIAHHGDGIGLGM